MVERSHGPLLRHPTIGPPCVASLKGCPVGHIDRPKRLTPTGQAIYNHYLECRAIGQFPDDPLVRRHAAIIYRVEQAIERMERQAMMRIVCGQGPRATD